MNIEIIAGSPRKNSTTLRVAQYLQSRLKENTDHNIGLLDMRKIKMPSLENVWSTPDAAPAELKEVAQRMFDADAYIIVTPEYNGSYTPALKNLLDHFPKQHRKPFGLVTASPGALGGMRAAQQLLLLTAALFGIASPYMLIVPQVDKKFNEQAQLVDEAFENSIHTFVTEFLWLSERLTANVLVEQNLN